MSMNNRKRPFGSTFRTLHDITNSSTNGGDGFGDVGGDGASGGRNTSDGKIAVRHIPSLPDSEKAAAILRRIHSDFHVIIERRGWMVTSITEMCCCGDGIDCLRKRGGRKTRTMPDNVLGYNRTGGSRAGKAHDIHLRLRHPRTHALFDYESVAGTMCHELAHCVRGPHDAKFYRAMEEIEEQYAVFLAKGVVLDKGGFPIGSSETHVLGGDGSGRASKKGRSKIGALAGRKKALEAAESRRKKNENGLTQGFTLGGKSSLAQKDPREAARIAAERRLLDAQYCLPCNEIIEILGEESSVEEDSGCEVELVEPAATSRKASWEEAKSAEKGLGAKPKAEMASSASDKVVDLTLDEPFASTVSPPNERSASPKLERTASNPDTMQSQWTCPKCTLYNPSVALVCYACHSEQPCRKSSLQQARELERVDEFASIKEKEVRQSKELFGFNIYGEKTNPSSTMNHLT